VFRDRVAQFEGRVFNTAGDAILAEFPSAVEALRAAIAIQEALGARNRDYPPERRVQFRMGITIGDVVERDGDLLGDGVNIAARLEGLAEPGGICISRSIQEAVANKVPAFFREIGPQTLKNIPTPVHAFPGRAGRPSRRETPPRAGESALRSPPCSRSSRSRAAGVLWAIWPSLRPAAQAPSRLRRLREPIGRPTSR
jgi:class 3 adenylate cyclase